MPVFCIEYPRRACDSIDKYRLEDARIMQEPQVSVRDVLSPVDLFTF